MDETSWHYCYARSKVLAPKGTEEVPAQLPDDPRRKFTAIATIAADGSKFPPIFIAKGTTESVHSHFAQMMPRIDPLTNTPRYYISHSKGGNTNKDVMLLYLDLVQKWNRKKPCALVIDRYSSHNKEEIIQAALDRQIELIFIPTSGTDQYQPLDIRIFGVMKAKAASEYDKHYAATLRAFTTSEAADVFINCWNKIDPTLIQNAWDICLSRLEISEHEEEGDEDEDDDSTYFARNEDEEDYDDEINSLKHQESQEEEEEEEEEEQQN